MARFSLPAILGILAMSLVLLVACGPTAPPSQSGAPPVPTPHPDAPSDEDDSADKPTPDIPPTDKPTKPARPTPTRDPGDPPSPTKPLLPPPPTADPNRVPDSPPAEHPDGIAGCRTINLFVVPVEDTRYLTWCMETLSDDVKANCQGTGTADQELACARQRLAEVKDYGMRETFVPCAAITDQEAHATCWEDTARAHEEHYAHLIVVWNEILPVVDRDPEVKEHFNVMVECVQSHGKQSPQLGEPLLWQWLGDGPPPAGRRYEKEARWQQIVDSCAHESGLYDAQDFAWIATVRDLAKRDPDKAATIRDAGLVEVLETPGPAPFLINRNFAARQAGR